MKFECEFKAICEVEFLTPEKTLDYFLNSDWKDCFFTFDELSEVAEHLSYQVLKFSFDMLEFDGEYQPCYYPEGFPPFLVLDDNEPNTFTAKDNEMGDIQIRVTQELEHDYTSEMN